ncbi:XRE family transcriptional regulator [Virgisporangium aliadipatigenens]|uniref:XRE family transcriptional regulator n=1 Tax=Virgisporangium aliadipatigenens TaxID=741659 RepID=A0A8J3YQ59_9ACTN|nr:tetratricopeptide repeat protein [Virgisporangium aliadipatigenens]GIJ49634.1 XRE family transcriptional regulator [Virgisporangium aliadipatigenens]
MGLRIQVLGPVRAWRGTEEIDFGRPGQRAVLGLLALAGGRPVLRPELVDLLWAERPPVRAVNVIQTHVKGLRRLLEPDRLPRGRSAVLPAVGDGYALSVPPGTVDLAEFRRLVGAAVARQRAGELVAAAALLGEAVSLWTARPLADIPYLADSPRITALDRERHAALARYGDLMIATGSAVDVLAPLEANAGDHPLDELAQALLIRAYHAAGRRDDAFAAYEAVRRRLADQLGIDPGPELVAAHAELLRTSAAPTASDPATAAASTTGGRAAPAQLPADVFGFTGRERELAALDAALPDRDAEARPADRRGAEDRPTGGRDAGDRGAEGRDSAAQPILISAVAGTAGVGKSALAVHWAHRVRHRFPDGQLHVDLRGYDPAQPVPAATVLAGFLRALGLPGQQIPDELDELAARYRTEVADRRMLLLLDNAGSVEQVRPLLPGTPGCVVVVTSRDPLAGLVARHGARRIDLDLLPADEALALLGTLIGARVAAEPDAAAALVAQCARLPLALRLTAELAVGRPAARLADLVGELDDERERIDRLDAGGDPRTALRAVFSWSYRQLPAAAARAFHLMGLHPGPDLDVAAAAALIGADGGAPLDGLARAYLIRPTGDGRYGMHDLLRAYAAELSSERDDAQTRRAALDRLLAHYLAAATRAMDLLYPAEQHRRPEVADDAAPGPRWETPEAAGAWLDTELPNLRAVCLHAARHGRPEYPARMGGVLSRYLNAGHPLDALAIYESVLTVADPAGHALTRLNLGGTHIRLGRYDRAEEHYRRALAAFRAIGDETGAARALGGLGLVCEAVGRYAAAAGHFADALVLFERLGDATGQVRAITSLGLVESRFGRHARAVEHHQRALRIARGTDDRFGVASTLLNLGLAEFRSGRCAAAAEHQREALAISTAIGDRFGAAHALTNLGDLARRDGRHAAAVGHHERALATFRELQEPYGEACAQNGLGEALGDLGQYAEAIERHGGALSIAAAIGDREEHARAAVGLGEAYAGAGDLAAARRHLECALALYTELGAVEAGDVRARLHRLPTSARAS